jgi:hypothetical protein
VVDVSQARRAGWWRWLAVAAGAAILASLPGLIAAWPVNTPATPIEQLYARMAASASTPYQGFALSTGTAGLPSLPQLAGAIGLLNGETQLRVWYASPGRWRVDQIGVGTETDLYQEPTDQAIWDFGTNQLTTIIGDQPVRLPRGADLVPADLGRRVISIVGSHPTGVSALPARRVAGIAAAGLRITPADPQTTVGHIDLWADPTTGVTLQVEISGRGASRPILVTRFLDIDFSTPAASVLNPPPGGPSTTYTFTAGSDIAQAFRSLRPGPLPGALGGFARTDDPTTSVGLAAYGSGLTRFLVLPVPRRIYEDAYRRIRDTGGVHYGLPGGRGVIVATQLLTVMAMDSDLANRNYLLVGLVSPTTLHQAGNDLSTFIGGPPQ